MTRDGAQPLLSSCAHTLVVNATTACSCLSMHDPGQTPSIIATAKVHSAHAGTIQQTSVR